MWIPDRTKLVKVRLRNGTRDVETLWAERVRARASSALEVRLANVPFLHAKPTYEDVVVVEPDPEDGFPTWDGANLRFEEIPGSLIEDAGRWAMIVDWAPRRGTDPQSEFEQIDRSSALLNVAAEGMGKAVPRTLGVEEVLRSLETTLRGLKLNLVHPR